MISTNDRELKKKNVNCLEEQFKCDILTIIKIHIWFMFFKITFIFSSHNFPVKFKN